ncbi:hypothetical protein ASD04_00530 [Devosia sp. Root436]|uniref:O-antigen ligase family protein n=1 Tax=Devosia sp. Root436 TaxID=1736537 RepID=UPI0006FBF4BA|nr:O-antigen ligase family protein [Devosia sp. Root436]KQX42494.1 hypothetical protein ASD04_00530 [Devosia sp. Root436]
MTQIEISRATTSDTQGSTVGTGQAGVNTAMFWYLLTILAVAPLPLGSNRPFFWGLWAVAIGLGGVAYTLILRRKREQFRVRLSALGLPMVLFVVVCAYLFAQTLPIAQFLGLGEITINGVTVPSRTISLAPTATILMLIRQLTFGLLFFLVMQVSVNDQRRSLLVKGLLIIALVYAAYGLYNLTTGDTILGMPKWGYQHVATGTFVNRNSFATYLGLGAVIALTQIGRILVRQAERHEDDGRIQGNGSWIVLYLIAYIILVATLMTTGSRMGLAATVAGSAVVVLLTAWGMRRIKAVLYAVPAIVLLLAAGFVAYGSRLLDRLGSVDSDVEVRGALYAQVIDLISLRPLTGFGGGAFEQAFPLVHQAPVSFDLVWQKAHSTYLSLWAELGLIVGSLPLLAVALLAWRMLASLRAGRGSWSGQTVALAAITVCGVHSLLDFSLEIEAVAFTFVALLAAGAATVRPKGPREAGTV